MEEMPLVSFCLLLFNQREFAAEALVGAFEQDYPNLEIVINDDHSTDGTYEVAEKMVKEYLARGGRHRVICYRNDVNLGNLGNFIAAGARCSADLIVKADGDDVSLPNRVSRIVQAWTADGRRAKVISHGARKVDIDGHFIGNMWTPSARCPLGACQAYVADCWKKFGSAADPRITDDVVFSNRALMLGGELVIQDRLVNYRAGSGVSSVYKKQRGPAHRGFCNIVKANEQSLRDARYFMGDVCARPTVSRIEDDLKRAKANVILTDSMSSFGEKWRAYRCVAAPGFLNWRRYFQAIYLLPSWMADVVLDNLAKLKILFALLRTRQEGRVKC